ncbi:RNA-directed DNA polymerase, eukaryota, reverse transcriptase zinc-binding domain protein [Tanacetum coccineum]
MVPCAISEGRLMVEMDPLIEEGSKKWGLTVRWVAGICLNKPEPTRLPLWVKIFNVPLEAWNVEGISRIASRIGTPIIMDKLTTAMCQKGYGRASFARVLIEVDAAKGIVDTVEIWYRGLNRKMELKVDYAWQPPMCSYCCVFGHSFKSCNSRTLSKEEKAKRLEAKDQTNIKNGNTQSTQNVNVNDRWQSVPNRSNFRSDTENGHSQAQQTNPNGVRFGRNGFNFGRGGYISRGRGGMSRGEGFNGVQVNEEKRYVPVKNNEKNKASDMEGIQNQENGKSKKNDQDSKVKHIAQRNFSASNRYSILADENTEEEDDNLNELQVIWEMNKSGKIALLKNKIKILKGDISTSKRSIDFNTQKKDNESVVEEMDDAIKDSWSHEMIEFYKASIDEDMQNENEYVKRMKTDDAMDDEVGEDLSAHAGFMTQNMVSNIVDATMANMVRNDDAIKFLISENKLNMCAIIETRLKEKIVNSVCDSVFWNWLWLNNSMDSNKGCRIVVGWDSNVIEATLLSSSDQTMHFEVKLIQDKKRFYISFIYGENEGKDRLKLWENLCDHLLVTNGEPWAILGDFNAILSPDEHSKGIANVSHGIREFRSCIESLDMEDLAMNGLFFTWVQKKKDPKSGFMDLFESCYASFLPYVTSNHYPALLVLTGVTTKRIRSFRFMNYLADKYDFHQVVKENWKEPIKGYAMFVLAKRLKNKKRHLRDLNKKNENVYEKVKVLRAELKKVQEELDKDPHNSRLREDEMLINCAYRNAAMDEEKVLKQKTKVEWLKEGDQNSAYFHNLLKGRLNKSRIIFLGTEDEIFSIEEPEELFTKKIDDQSALHTIREVSNDEAKAALFDIDDDKALGPDGFTSKFFKDSWETVGMDLCDVVKEFFKSGKMLGELNTTLISLVPKCKIPVKVTDYRPIACYNVVYKCISKELMCGYLSKNKVARCTFKVDVQKAYDTMSWSFLEFCLIKLGLHQILVGWIMVCLKSASFSICVNGESHGFFKALRGLRQGDPISPYLFTIVMEVFTLMLKRQIQSEKKFIYHWGCRELKIVNFCFADDLMLFCHGDVISASVLRRSLDEFCLSSGLRPNMTKSTVYFGNVADENDCYILFDKIKRRIEDWRNKDLSFAGRMQLISSVLCSLNVYWDSIFILPKGVCEEIDKLIKAFLWKTDGKKGGRGGGCKYSVSWKEVCKPKNEGGLGFKSLQVWNEALMAKHLWDIIIDKDSIWVKWVKGQWLKNDSIWAVEVHDHTSWGWKQILSLRNKVRNFIHFKIGNGKKFLFWFDKWNVYGPLCKLVYYASIMQSSLIMKTKVADLISNKKWNWPRRWSERFREVLEIQVPTINEEFEDKAIWFNKKGKEKIFCVSEVWKGMKNDSPKVIWCNHVWFSQCVPRHSFILWMAIKGRLKTQDRLSRWLTIQDMKCPLCRQCKDYHNHLFFSCNYSRRLWERLKGLANLDNVTDSWAQIISSIVNKPATNTIWSVIQRLVWRASVYYMWQERNIRLFGNGSRTEEELFKIIFEVIGFLSNSMKDSMLSFIRKNWVVWPSSSKTAIHVQDHSYILKAYGFLMRQGSWVIIYLVFILFMDCTRGNDIGWHFHSSLCSCLRFTAYGDVPSYAGWSQCNFGDSKYVVSFSKYELFIYCNEYVGL